MSARLLLISSDAAIAASVRSAVGNAMSLMEIDHLPADRLSENYQPNAILIDADVRTGMQTAFERIAAVKKNFAVVPVLVLGNEMSAQLVLAALRAGADDFIDRDAGAEDLHLAIHNCLARKADVQAPSRAKVAVILSARPSEQDQDFALNLAVRAARRSKDRTLFIDLSVPATEAGIALGLETAFTAADAIRELARVDQALLESALARDAQSGLYIMPLCADFGAEVPSLDAARFAALLQVLRSFFGTIVLYCGPFSRQRALLASVGPARFFVCCNQRFPSLRGASELLHWLSENALGTAEVVVHALAPLSTPSAADIRDALKVRATIDIAASWDELAESVNRARPLAMSETRYSRGLDHCLALLGIGLAPEPAFPARLRAWLRLGVAAEAS